MAPLTHKRCSPKKLALALLALALTCLAAEIALRLLAPARNQSGVRQDLHRLGYRHDSELGWSPLPAATHTFVASRTTTVSHNARGFRDAEHLPDARPGLLVLGDSFVWGYDVEAAERFTDLLAAGLPAWQVFNAGVCGFGTDQEFLLLQRHLDFYHPRAVLLVFCVDNDQQDNTSNQRYGGSFKPYFVLADGALALRGVPVPRSARLIYQRHPTLYRLRLARLGIDAFARLRDPPVIRVADPTLPLILAMHRDVTARGAAFMVALTDRHPALESFLTTNAIPFLDCSTAERYPDHGRHWTPAGHATLPHLIRSALPSP